MHGKENIKNNDAKQLSDCDTHVLCSGNVFLVEGSSSSEKCQI